MILFVFGNCQKANTRRIESIIIEGVWIVDLFQDAKLDQTADYSGFVFTFQKTGKVDVEKGSKIFRGTWAIENGSKNFNLSLTDPLQKLKENWSIMYYTTTKVELKSLNDNGSIKLLTFRRQ